MLNNDLANKNNIFPHNTIGNSFTEVAHDAEYGTGYGAVMDSIASNISNYKSGQVYSITNGPVYTVIMNKGSDKYYSAIVFTYYSTSIHLFVYNNGKYQYKQIV